MAGVSESSSEDDDGENIDFGRFSGGGAGEVLGRLLLVDDWICFGVDDGMVEGTSEDVGVDECEESEGG